MAPIDPPSFHLRLPPRLLKQVKVAAAENDRSMNAEIVARIERSFTLGEDDRARAVKLLAEALVVLDKGRR